MSKLDLVIVGALGMLVVVELWHWFVRLFMHLGKPELARLIKGFGLVQLCLVGYMLLC
jgi:hypothetical protein